MDWFGFCPDFHDAALDRLEVSGGDAILAIRAFRMTGEVDAPGYFVLDRHALVTLHMRGVTGLKLEGDAGSVIAELLIRRLPSLGAGSTWTSCAGPAAGDIEIAFDTSIGLHGAIYAKDMAFELRPLPKTAAV